MSYWYNVYMAYTKVLLGQRKQRQLIWSSSQGILVKLGQYTLFISPHINARAWFVATLLRWSFNRYSRCCIYLSLVALFLDLLFIILIKRSIIRANWSTSWSTTIDIDKDRVVDIKIRSLQRGNPHAVNNAAESRQLAADLSWNEEALIT